LQVTLKIHEVPPTGIAVFVYRHARSRTGYDINLTLLVTYIVITIISVI
jgi:hypothetical protein